MHIFAISYRAAIMAQKVSQAVYDSGKRESIPKKEKDRPKTRGCAGVYNVWIKIL